MEELKCYQTTARGNIVATEVVPIKIFTHNTLDESTIILINNMPFDEVRKIGKTMDWQVLRLDD